MYGYKPKSARKLIKNELTKLGWDSDRILQLARDLKETTEDPRDENLYTLLLTLNTSVTLINRILPTGD